MPQANVATRTETEAREGVVATALIPLAPHNSPPSAMTMGGASW